MDTLKNIQGVIFDYGGTIDTNSCHWAEVLWTKYMEHQVPVDKESFREAYVFGERALAKYPFVQPWHNFHDVLSIKTKLQVEWLAEQRKLPMDELQLQSYAVKVADSCYGYVLDILQVTRPVVKELAKKYRLALRKSSMIEINSFSSRESSTETEEERQFSNSSIVES